MSAVLCSGCHYLMSGASSPRGSDWCGWMGGEPDPGNPEKCHPQPRTGLPEGLAVAKSSRIVPIAILAEENESFADATGRLD